MKDLRFYNTFPLISCTAIVSRMLSVDMRLLHLSQRTLLFTAQVAWTSCIASPYLKVPQGVRNGKIISYFPSTLLTWLPIVKDGLLGEKQTKVCEQVPFLYTCGRNLGVNKFKDVAIIPISVKRKDRRYVIRKLWESD